MDEVAAALKKMKRQSPSLVRASSRNDTIHRGYWNSYRILDLCNGIVKEGCIPEDGKSSMVLPIYKGKGDSMECGSYRGIKLLEHAMKVEERIFKNRIRQQINIDNKQFGFMKGKGTTDAIFMRESIYAIARICHRNSICLSVCHTGGSVKSV